MISTVRSNAEARQVPTPPARSRRPETRSPPAAPPYGRAQAVALRLCYSCRHTAPHRCPLAISPQAAEHYPVRASCRGSS
jgi:hypothetical protein